MTPVHLTAEGRWRFFSIIVLAIICAGLPAVAVGAFDAGSWYRLSTQWQGACRSLAIVNDGNDHPGARLS